MASKIKMLQNNVITGDIAFQEFLRHCKRNKLASPTVKNYVHWWGQFSKWFTGSIPAISEDTIKDWMDYLDSTGIQAESINTALRHIRAILNYYASQNYCQHVAINLLTVEEKIKDCYTDFELQTLLRKPDITKVNFPTFRTWAIINFFVGTGCRANSLVNVKIKDIDFDNDMVTLTTTKNKKPQILPMGDVLQQVLKVYLKHRQGQPQDYLFPSEGNTRLLVSSLYHNVEDYNTSRGIDKKGLHLFRHTFGKNWILENGNVFILQKQLGHKNISMTQKYSNLYGTDLKGTEQFNLLERIKEKPQSITMKQQHKRGRRP